MVSALENNSDQPYRFAYVKLAWDRFGLDLKGLPFGFEYFGEVFLRGK